MPRLIHYIDKIDPQLAEDPELLGLIRKLVTIIDEHIQSYGSKPLLSKIVAAAKDIEQIIIFSYLDRTANGYWFWPSG